MLVIMSYGNVIVSAHVVDDSCCADVNLAAVGQPNAGGMAKPGSKWRVVSDKLGQSEGPGGLAALLQSMNKITNSSQPTTSLPMLVGPDSTGSDQSMLQKL